MKRRHSWYLLPFFLLAAGALAAQTIVPRMVVLQRTVDAQGYFDQRETYLSGDQVARFTWEEYAVPSADVLVYSYSGREPLSVFSKVNGVRIIGQEGQKADYSLSPDEVPLEKEGKTGWFLRETEGETDYLPRLLVKPAESDLYLLWTDTGECPDERTEDALPPGLSFVLLLDADQQILQQRTIYSATLKQTDGTLRKRVYVQVETPETPMPLNQFRWQREVREARATFEK